MRKNTHAFEKIFSYLCEIFLKGMRILVFKYIVFLNRVLKENRSKILIVEKVTIPLKDSNLLFFS